MLSSPASFRSRLLKWYDRNRRDLPWRITAPGGALDPYHVLVSETMLQQTQVATVIPYYHRFLERFPTLVSLASAPEQEVLRLWQGLGYYSRARNLQAAARMIVADHAGNVPCEVEELLRLPGVGRYTAGAVSSIAFGRNAPILDGNVQRVLCRLDRIEADPRNREVQKVLWQRAAEILPRRRVGDFNSALMELGATVCIPRTPQCPICPVRPHCEAAAAGVQERIPPAKKSLPTPLLRRQTFCIRNGDRWLLEQRPAKGRWAGMWQFITRPATDQPPQPTLHVKTTHPTRIGTVTHALTHRRYEFEVFACEVKSKPSPLPPAVCWASLEEVGQLPLPRPQLKIVEMLTTKSSRRLQIEDYPSS